MVKMCQENSEHLLYKILNKNQLVKSGVRLLATGRRPAGADFYGISFTFRLQSGKKMNLNLNTNRKSKNSAGPIS